MRVLCTAFALLPVTAYSFSSGAALTGRTAAATATATVQHSSLSSAANGDLNGFEEKKKVIILGGDGFCGWPTSLYLSDRGHDVVIVDNLSRRKIDLDLGCDSLTPISSMEVSLLPFPSSYLPPFLLFACIVWSCVCAAAVAVAVAAIQRVGRGPPEGVASLCVRACVCVFPDEEQS